MVDWVDKGFQSAMINRFKELNENTCKEGKKKHGLTNEEIGNPSREIKTLKKRRKSKF